MKVDMLHQQFQWSFFCWYFSKILLSLSWAEQPKTPTEVRIAAAGSNAENRQKTFISMFIIPWKTPDSYSDSDVCIYIYMYYIICIYHIIHVSICVYMYNIDVCIHIRKWSVVIHKTMDSEILRIQLPLSNVSLYCFAPFGYYFSKHRVLCPLPFRVKKHSASSRTCCQSPEHSKKPVSVDGSYRSPNSTCFIDVSIDYIESFSRLTNSINHLNNPHIHTHTHADIHTYMTLHYMALHGIALHNIT